MTLPADVFTFEESHELVRLTKPRPTDLGSVPADGERSAWKGDGGRFANGNRYGAERGAKTAAVGSLKEARRRVRRALREATDPETADVLQSEALTLYQAAARDLRSHSILVLGPLVRFAVNSALAGHYSNACTRAGYETQEGARLLGLAHACETRAERAETMAIAAARALAERQPPKANTKVRSILAAGEGSP